MLDIGLTMIRQERVQSSGKERPGSCYCCTMSENGMGFVETVLGRKGVSFFLYGTFTDC